MIKVVYPFILYAKCDVIYVGRASSTLVPGNYLIIHKNDGTIKIEGSELFTPLNYQPPGAMLIWDESKKQLISNRNDEQLIITLYDIFYYKELKHWSNNKIHITKTESELRDKIYEQLNTILGVSIKEAFKEFRTPVGSIDILAVDENEIYHIIEVKRGKPNISACGQLDRYCSYFDKIGQKNYGYIASPKITSNALKYINESSNRKYINVNY